MKNLIFAGCSFTHAPDSWAHCSNPWRDERNKTQAEIEQKTKAYTRTEFGGTRHSQEHVEKMYAERLKDYPPNRIRNFKPEHIWDDVRKLPKDQFSINILGSGANSNTDIARSVIHFIEHFSGEVDTCIFQITGFQRQTKFVEWVEIDPADPHYFHTHYDDICFDKLEKHQASPDDDWHCIEAIEALQNLTTFCKANNVNIKYFHGWDNRPGGASEFNYFTKKYMRYVEPNLLTSSNILDIASRTLKPNEVFQHNDGHPSTLSHKHFWNTIIYPYIVRN